MANLAIVGVVRHRPLCRACLLWGSLWREGFGIGKKDAEAGGVLVRGLCVWF